MTEKKLSKKFEALNLHELAKVYGKLDVVQANQSNSSAVPPPIIYNEADIVLS